MYENYKTKNLYKKQSISPSKIYNNKKLIFIFCKKHLLGI